MIRKFAGMATASALVASVFASAPAFAATSVIGEGSGFANGILQPAITAYNAKANNAYSVTYTKSKSGTGRSKYFAGTVDFAATDATYEAAGDSNVPSNFVYVPIVGAPIAIAYNLPTVGQGLKLSAKVIGSIYDGSITKWNDPAIKALNKSATLPDRTIQVKYRTAGSGTSFNLAGYLAANKVGNWTANSDLEVANGPASMPGTTVPDAATMVTTIDNTSYSIGYADLSDADKKGLTFAKLANVYKSGSKNKTEFVLPTVVSANKFFNAQSINANGSVSLKWATTKVKGAYNLSAVTYVVAPKSADTSAKGSAIKDFLTFLVGTKTKRGFAETKAASLGYVAFSGAFKNKAIQKIAVVK